jgi:hypothetical protein
MYIGSNTVMAPAGAGMPVKKFPAHAGLLGSSIIADRKNQRGNPARRFEVMQTPQIQDQRRRDAEVHEIRQTVELSPKSRSAFEHPRDPAIDAVEQGGKNDRRQCQFELVLYCQPNSRKAST